MALADQRARPVLQGRGRDAVVVLDAHPTSANIAKKVRPSLQILMSLPDTPERAFKIKVLEEAANALIFVDYMNVKDQFAEYIASSKKPLTSIQKQIVKEMFMTSESNPQEEK